MPESPDPREIGEARDFRALANSIPQLAWMADATGSIFWYNDRWYEYTGTTLDEMRGWGWRAVHHPDHVDRVVARIRHAFETGEPWDDTFPLRSRTGEYRWFLSRAMPIKDAQGSIIRWFGTNTDITEHRAAAAEREQLLERITDAFFAVDRDWRFTYVNREAERVLQRSREDLFGKNIWQEFPNAIGTVLEREYRRAMATQTTIEFEDYYPPRGIWLEVRAYPSPQGLSVYFHDVTARKQTERALRDSEARYRLLADMIPQNIWTTDPAGSHTYFSRRWYDYTGATAEDSHGEGWLRFIHPDDRERTIARWRHSLETGEPYEIEYRFRGADGTYHWFLGKAMPLRNDTGAIIEWFGTATDISERKRLEHDREKLIRGFSHDVRNPLGAADGYLYVMSRIDQLTEAQQDKVARARRSIKAAVNLIDDLLDISRAQFGEIEITPAQTDVRALADEAADEYRAQAEAKGLALAIELSQDVPGINSDARRIRQVVGNLLSNAVKYTDHGRITVGVAMRDGGNAPGPGHWIAIDVTDTGPGIPEGQHSLLFEEFRRLDTAGTKMGAGIGLAIGRRIAMALGGDITVQSEVGRGSTFTLWLPCP